MSTLSTHLNNVLGYAERGHVLDDDDAARIPDALVDDVRAATQRIADLGGNRAAARMARREELHRLKDAAFDVGVDPTRPSRRSGTAIDGEVREALDDPRDDEIREIVDSMPRGF